MRRRLVGNDQKRPLLGSPEKLAWTRTADGLEVTLPAQKPCDHAYVLKIDGLDLAASAPVAPPRRRWSKLARTARLR